LSRPRVPAPVGQGAKIVQVWTTGVVAFSIAVTVTVSHCS
jgi:hypothetical protein